MQKSVVICFVLFMQAHLPVGGANIMLDQGRTYQTMRGWEVVGQAAHEHARYPEFRDELLSRTVNEVGINRIRLEVRSGFENSTDYWSQYVSGEIPYSTFRANRYATVNDNNDATVLNPAGFHFSMLDHTIETLILPMRELLRANGEELYVNLTYVAFTGQITEGGSYHHANPQEYAEFILATFQHVDSNYGFVPDALEILLEPDNVSQWNGNLMGRAIVATQARLSQVGYQPEIIAPATTSMSNASSYFDGIAAVPGALDHLTEFAYHRYRGVSSTALQNVVSRARTHQLSTSMLEWWSDQNGHEILHQDLKVGMNSAWQHGVIGWPGSVNNSMTIYPINLESTPATIQLNRKARFCRHYYKFVRFGATRFAAATDNGQFDPLAFINRNGQWTVVIKAARGGTFQIHQLPPGRYGIKYTTELETYVSRPDVVLGSGESLQNSIPAAGVVTVYSIQPDENGSGARVHIEKSSQPNQLELSWRAKVGKEYRLLRSDDLEEWQFGDRFYNRLPTRKTVVPLNESETGKFWRVVEE